MATKITADHVEAFKRGELRELRVGAASLELRWEPLPGLAGLGSGAMPKERVWVMTSTTTGSHRLAAISTDLERLNAHWQGFHRTANERMPRPA